MQSIKIVLIGACGYGFNYFGRVAALQEKYAAEIAGVVDLHYEACPLYEELREKGVPFYRALADFYRGHTADLAIVAAPIHFHKELSLLAMQNGSHVLCEKPAAGCAEDARLMQEAAEQYGKFLIIGFQWSYSLGIERLKKDILTGAYGKAIAAKSLVLWPRTLDYYKRSWAGYDWIDGKCVMDSPASNATAHYIHNMLFLLGGRPNEAAPAALQEAVLYRANDIKTFDAYELSMLTPEGVAVYAYGAHCVNRQVNPILEMKYEKADIRIDMNTHQMYARLHDGSQVNYPVPDSETTDIRVLAAALQAIQSGDSRGLLCDIRTAMEHVKLMDAVNAHIPQVYVFSDKEKARLPQKDTTLLFAPGLAEKLIERFEKAPVH